jgi:nicotinate-nucleotide adenylyltransferase
MKIGIFGGSFNPVHLAHLIVAEAFSDSLNLDLTLFIPAYYSPFKERNEYIIKDKDRVNMLKLALKNNPKFDIELFEIKQKKISYTNNTIKFLKNKYPNDEFYLLIGIDQALSFKKWHNWEKILDSVQLCIANRNSPNELLSLPYIESELSYKNKKPFFIQSPLIEISSSNIRQQISNEKSIKYLVKEQVEKYIYKHNLYIKL